MGGVEAPEGCHPGREKVGLRRSRHLADQARQRARGGGGGGLALPEPPPRPGLEQLTQKNPIPLKSHRPRRTLAQERSGKVSSTPATQ